MLSPDLNAGVVSAALGALAALLSALVTFRRSRMTAEAEKRLVHEIRRAEADELYRAVREWHTQLARALVERAATNLGSEDRRSVDEALYQPSERGRMSYVQKLLAEAAADPR
jgi:hypothetical protein